MSEAGLIDPRTQVVPYLSTLAAVLYLQKTSGQVAIRRLITKAIAPGGPLPDGPIQMPPELVLDLKSTAAQLLSCRRPDFDVTEYARFHSAQLHELADGKHPLPFDWAVTNAQNGGAPVTFEMLVACLQAGVADTLDEAEFKVEKPWKEVFPFVVKLAGVSLTDPEEQAHRIRVVKLLAHATRLTGLRAEYFQTALRFGNGRTREDVRKCIEWVVTTALASFRSDYGDYKRKGESPAGARLATLDKAVLLIPPIQRAILDRKLTDALIADLRKVKTAYSPCTPGNTAPLLFDLGVIIHEIDNAPKEGS